MSISVAQFVQTASDSGLLSAAEAERLRADHDAEDATELADELVRSGRLTSYQAEAICSGRTRHLSLGDYTILDRIGAGGMGEVYKARHLRLDRLAAIKILPEAALGTPGAVDRFYQEVKTAAQLMHPNIVVTHDAGESRDVHYLVMEYVEGRDLSTIVQQQGRMTLEQAVTATLQAATGLRYAHGRGIVHRDIKPSNLLLDTDGVVKILDMGLARMSELQVRDATRAERLTMTGQVMGTFDYMSPEQAEDARQADERSDVYSLGCTLFRLLTGEAPYPRDTMIQVMLAHRESPVPSVRELRGDVPEALDRIVQKAIAKKPEDRYPGMTALIEALESVLGGAVNAAPADESQNKLSALAKMAGTIPPDSANAETIGPQSSIEDTASKPPVVSDPLSDIPESPFTAGSQPVKLTAMATAAEWSDDEVLVYHRGPRLLIMGIVSIALAFVIVGAVVGFIGLMQARHDLQEMDAGRMEPSGRVPTRVGYALGGIAVTIGLFRIASNIFS